MLDIRVGGYRITERLAKGGMGEVYLARHEIMNREAAVKVLHSEFGDKKELVERFLNEARAAASIRHPGIVEIYDVGHVDGRAYIVMEYLRGELLAQRLARTRIEVDKALLLTRQLAGALGAAHACGIIHRDLKPENIFVVPDPDVLGGERTKILDFGIAKLMESQAVVHTMQGAMFGTPAYMAPEQCEDAGQVDRRADLYALGCILYELLSGTPPFGRGGIELVAAHLRDQPTPLRRRVPALPESLEAVVMRLLAKNPDDRFPTCEALVRALDQVQGEHGGVPPLALVYTDAAGASASAPPDIITADTEPSMQRGPIASARATVGVHADTGSPASESAASASQAGTSRAGTSRAGSHAGIEHDPSHVGPTHGSFSLPPEEVAGPVMLAAPTVAPRSRWLSWLIAVVALLVAGAAGLWLLRVAPVMVSMPVDASAVPVDAGVPGPDAGLDLRVLLDRAREAYERQDWHTLRKLRREVMRRTDQRSELWLEADNLRQRNQGEKQFADIFERFESALAEGDVFAAIQRYKELPPGSGPREKADDLWTNWETAQLKAADRYAKQGQCTKVEEIQQQVRRAAEHFPIFAAPIDKLLKRCRQRRQDDRDRDPPGPGGQEPGGQEPGGQEPGGQEPGGQEPGGQEPGGQEPGGQEPGGQEPGGQEPGGQEPGGQEPGGQEPGGGNQTPGGQEPGGGTQEPGGGNQEPGGQEPGAETQGLRLAGQEIAIGGQGGPLPPVAAAQLRQRLAPCAREGNVQGPVAVSVEVGSGRRITSVAVEPGHEGLDRCVRDLTGQRVAARPGSYRSTLQLP